MSDTFLLDPDYKDFDFTDKQNLKPETIYGEQYSPVRLIVLFPIVLFYGAVVIGSLCNLLPNELGYLITSHYTAGVVTRTCLMGNNSYTYFYNATGSDGNNHQYTGTDGGCPGVGETVTVYYFPYAPQSSARTMPSGSSFLLNICAIGVGAAVSTFFVRLYFHKLRRTIRAMQTRPKYALLNHTTTIIGGKLISIRTSEKDKLDIEINPHGYYIEVDYEFQVEGHVFKGTQIKRRDDLKDKSLPICGTPIRVLYANDSAYVML